MTHHKENIGKQYELEERRSIPWNSGQQLNLWKSVEWVPGKLTSSKTYRKKLQIHLNCTNHPLHYSNQPTHNA